MLDLTLRMLNQAPLPLRPHLAQHLISHIHRDLSFRSLTVSHGEGSEFFCGASRVYQGFLCELLGLLNSTADRQQWPRDRKIHPSSTTLPNDEHQKTREGISGKFEENENEDENTRGKGWFIGRASLELLKHINLGGNSTQNQNQNMAGIFPNLVVFGLLKTCPTSWLNAATLVHCLTCFQADIRAEALALILDRIRFDFDKTHRPAQIPGRERDRKKKSDREMFREEVGLAIREVMFRLGRAGRAVDSQLHLFASGSGSEAVESRESSGSEELRLSGVDMGTMGIGKGGGEHAAVHRDRMNMFQDMVRQLNYELA